MTDAIIEPDRDQPEEYRDIYNYEAILLIRDVLTRGQFQVQGFIAGKWWHCLSDSIYGIVMIKDGKALSSGEWQLCEKWRCRRMPPISEKRREHLKAVLVATEAGDP